METEAERLKEATSLEVSQQLNVRAVDVRPD